MIREVVQQAGLRLGRVPRRYWMCLVIGLSCATFETASQVETSAYISIVRTPKGLTPYVPGAYTCPDLYSYAALLMRTLDVYETESPRFLWSRRYKHMTFLIFYWVPVITHLPSGVWADHYGGHRIVFWSLLSSSVLHLSMPLALYLGFFTSSFYFIVTLLRRVIAGIALPALMSLIAVWALPEERTTFVAVLYSFSRLPTFITGVGYVDRWSRFFCTSSALAFFAAVLWWKTARLWHDLLLHSHSTGRVLPPAKKVPLLRMVTSPTLLRLYLLAVAYEGAGHIAGLRTVLDYLIEALMFTHPVTMIEMLTTVTSEVLTSLAVGIVSDRLVSSGLTGLPAARRLFLATPFVGSALAVLLLIPAKCDTFAAYGCYVALGYFNVWQMTVVWTLPLDVAPCLAGTLFSLIEIIGHLAARIVFQTEIKFTRTWGQGDLNVWAVVFVTLALVMLILPLPYLIWGPFYELPWARRPSLEAAPNKSRFIYGILSMTTIALICILIIIASFVF